MFSGRIFLKMEAVWPHFWNMPRTWLETFSKFVDNFPKVFKFFKTQLIFWRMTPVRLNLSLDSPLPLLTKGQPWKYKFSLPQPGKKRKIIVSSSQKPRIVAREIWKFSQRESFSVSATLYFSISVNSSPPSHTPVSPALPFHSAIQLHNEPDWKVYISDINTQDEKCHGEEWW